MKARTSFLKRCIALVLAVMLMVSGTNMGIVLQAFAAGNETTVKIGQIVANNYDLTTEEKNLLSSGNLASSEYSYTVPTESDVSVDTDGKKITAANHGDWVPVKAYIVVGEEIAETVELTNGVGTYAYNKNAFSVKVEYTLDIQVAKEEQERLLNTAGWLKNGVANVDKLVAENSALATLEIAMPELVNLAKNGYEVFGNKVTVTEDVQNAIYALNDQMTNGGHLNLVIMQDAYKSGKTNYLLNNGLALKAELEATRENINWIYKNLTDIKNIVSSLGESFVDAATVNLINTLQAILGGWVNVADAVIAGDWNAANMGTALVSGSVNYAELDTQVAALGATSAPAVKNPLHVADCSVKVNLNMYNVTVYVSLVVVEDKADSDQLVEYAKTEGFVVTLSENATRDEILAAVAEAGVEEAALAGWTGVYKAEHFVKNESALPDNLTKDVEYEINYLPKTYEVKLSYGETMTVHYGYKYTLPKHAVAEQAYDYTVNGQKMAQGSVYTIVGDTEISRAAGKAYTSADLYTLIADNFGTGAAIDILKSGALKDNVFINIRKPDPADSESMIKLEGGKLKVEGKYAADYEGLNWVPYSYGEEGTEHKFGFEETEVDWAKASVKVKYILTLTNFTQDEVQAIEDKIIALAGEAKEQIETLDRLAAYHGAMKELDKTKLGALEGVIKYANLNADAAKNEALKAEFTKMIQGILNNNLEGNELRICAMLGEYNTGKLTYYYNNSAKVIGEINTLSGYLSGLLKDGNGLTAKEKLDALTVLVTDAGYPQYLDKITELERIMGEVQAALTAPNAMINLSSPNLYKLISALESGEAVDFIGADSPYLVSDNLSAIDDSQVQVQVIVDVNGKTATYTTPAQPRGYVLTQAEVNVLIDSVEGFAKQELGAKAPFYQADFSELADLVGTALDKKVTNVYITYGPITYTIEIAGTAKDVTIETPQIELPGHGTKGWVYTYDVFGASVEVAYGKSATYTLTAADFEKIAGGDKTITRTETNKAQEDLEDAVGDMETIELVKDADNNIVGVNVTVEAGQDSLMGFAMELTGLGYSYITLNDGVLLDTGVISLQTLMDAILADNTFGSETIIKLGKNNGGNVFSAKMDLGNGADDITFSDVDFTFTLNSAPGALKTVASGLEKVKNYMSFNAQDGVMALNLNLPEKVYEVYLTAMLGTGVVDKTDINALNAEIAYQYLYDYVDLIINSDANTTTYTNTLAKLGQNYDLTGAEKYYQMVKKALTNEGVQINPATDGNFDMSVTAAGQSAINGLFGLIGMDPSSFSTYLGLIKEYDGGELSVKAVATLKNVDTKFEALILDLNAGGVQNKFDYTADLPTRVKSIANNAAVILLGDIDGDLNFPGKTILDLNGFTVNGSVSGDLYIVDSSMATADEGTVTGSVKATAIFGGTYASNVSAFLKSGYEQVGGTVQNALFTVEKSGAKSATESYTYVINTSFLDEEIAYTTFAQGLAVEIAVDLVLNYFTAAAMKFDGNELYGVNFDKLLALLNSDSKVDDLITKTLNSINVPGIGDTAELIAEDLLNFAKIADALENGTAVAEHSITTAPWYVEVEHVTAGDYIDFGITSNASLAKTINIGIAFGGDHTKFAQKLTAELAKIVKVADIDIDLEQPTYANKTISASGKTAAVAEIDMSENKDYATIVGVILAYGNSGKRAAVAQAINTNNMTALKAVVDNTTVAEVFTALKALGRDVSFAKMAAAVGVTIDVASAGELESIYHLILAGSGKVLEELKITGMNSKLGNLYDEATGYYVLTKEKAFGPEDVTVRGYTAKAEFEVTNVTLMVKLFDNVDCLWGDADHDGDVDPDDATLILEYFVGLEVVDFCTLRTDVDGDGDIDPDDATYVLEYFVGLITKFPAELK